MTQKLDESLKHLYDAYMCLDPESKAAVFIGRAVMEIQGEKHFKKCVQNMRDFPPADITRYYDKGIFV